MNQEQDVQVWDRFIRFFHWTLVITFTLAYVTEDELLTVHVWSGYIVLILIIARIFWGFIGSPHARFSDFLFAPATIVQYLKDTLAHRAKRYLGHNPLGGLMVLLMLTTLTATGISGLIVYAAEENAGPLTGWWGNRGESEIIEEVHEVSANFTVFLVVIHIAGVITESFLHRENLIRAMFTGRKKPL